jgi:hypothetical protein
MEEQVSLDTLGEGAAVERFNLALQDAYNNIQDVNTPATAKREVTLKLSIKPNENRDIGDVSVEVTTKLASIRPFIVRFFMGRDKAGKGCATEYRPAPGLFDLPAEEKLPDKVYQMKKEVL